MQSNFKKKHVPLCSDKNCQSTICYKKSEYIKCDKNCQSTQYMWQKKPISNIWSVTKSSIMWLPNPAMEQSNPEDNNYHSTSCFKKKCPVRPVCDDKNCQSAKHMCCDKECHVKSEETHFSSHIWSVP